MLQILAPLLAAPFERIAGFKQLSPLEQNLQRVSHGMALIIAMLVMLALGSHTAVFPVLRDPSNRGLWITAAFVLVPIAYGVIRCRAGFRAFRYFDARSDPEAGLLRPRALVKVALGLGGIVYLQLHGYGFVYCGHWLTAACRLPGLWGSDEFWSLLGALVWAWHGWIYLAAFWCVFIGVVRFALLSRSHAGDPLQDMQDDINQHEFNW